jgi:hypothetical protein
VPPTSRQPTPFLFFFYVPDPFAFLPNYVYNHYYEQKGRFERRGKSTPFPFNYYVQKGRFEGRGKSIPFPFCLPSSQRIQLLLRSKGEVRKTVQEHSFPLLPSFSSQRIQLLLRTKRGSSKDGARALEAARRSDFEITIGSCESGGPKADR